MSAKTLWVGVEDDSGEGLSMKRKATRADLVAALQEEGVGEVLMEVVEKNAPVLADGRYLEPGRYLVVRIDGEET